MSIKTRVVKLESAEPQYRTNADIVHFFYYGIYPPGRENLPPPPRSEEENKRIIRIKEKIDKKINNRTPEEKQKDREYKADLRAKQKARRLKELHHGKC